MIGRSEQIPDWSQRDRDDAEPVLELRGVATRLGHAGIDLTLRRGEIVGLYGLVGAGRSELAKAIWACFPSPRARSRSTGRPCGSAASPMRCIVTASAMSARTVSRRG